jgi:hypothetical protein
MRANVVIVAICEFLLISNTAAAQNDSVAHSPGGYVPPRAWIVPVGIVASYVIDPELREWVLHEHTHSLDRLAKSVNALGTGDRLIPAMAITYIGALLTRREALASGTLNAAAAYVASDLAESALKTIDRSRAPACRRKLSSLSPIHGKRGLAFVAISPRRSHHSYRPGDFDADSLGVNKRACWQLSRARWLGSDLRRPALDERCDRDDCSQLRREHRYHPVARIPLDSFPNARRKHQIVDQRCSHAAVCI